MKSGESIFTANRHQCGFRIFSAAMAICLATPVAIHAQEAKTLDEIVVTGTGINGEYAKKDASTGTKTDTPLMETPLSVQVIPLQVLQDQQATTLDQALTNVSGVMANSKLIGGWTEQIYLRGFVTEATFRDGFRINDPNNNNLTASLSNVDSIEVLKGPAAVLYGRVEPGGMVNMITKKPLADPYYAIEQAAGSWNHYITSFDATSPLNDDKTLLYRLIASYDAGNSWREGIKNQRTFIAPTLEWKPDPRTDVLVEATYSHNLRTMDIGWYPVDPNTNQFAPVDISKDPVPIHYSADTTDVGLTWSHQFDPDWTIKHQIRRILVIGNYPAQAIVNSVFLNGNVWMFDRYMAQISPRQTTDGTVMDLTGHFTTEGIKHTLLTGWDYYRLKADYPSWSGASGAATTWVNPAPATGLVLDPTLYYDSNTTTDNLGLYLQDQMQLPHEIFLMAGWRYQDVRAYGTTTMPIIWGGTETPIANTPQHDSATTPRYGILWKARDWLSLYASYAENFGANNGVDWQGQPLPPEGARQDEVGAKTEYFGGRLNSSLALFDLTKTHVAVADITHDPTGIHGWQTTIGAINSRGVEFDLQGKILPYWNAIVSYTLDRVVITRSTPGSYYVQGLRMANDPEHMLKLWSTYEFARESADGWKIGGGVTWRGESWDATNTVLSPGYAVWDAMASYEFRLGKQRADFQLNINNLTDRLYYQGAALYGSRGAKFYGDPRSAMGSIRVEF